ncbi:hypothetical protein [Methylocapsa sp. S129]|uniref:hypothetical protein n=1 Tax=Methylocapsa sp. S129 TaxID=1641869 RepID=UPI00131B3BB7|nr:hypothetical protein [Methylocapsa sp. S129]
MAPGTSRSTPVCGFSVGAIRSPQPHENRDPAVVRRRPADRPRWRLLQGFLVERSGDFDLARFNTPQYYQDLHVLRVDNGTEIETVLRRPRFEDVASRVKHLRRE